MPSALLPEELPPEASRPAPSWTKGRRARQAVRALVLGISVFTAGSCTDEGGPVPSLSVPDLREEPPPPKAERPTRSRNAVTYTIARGGTLLHVANLYKIHHHEIIALNPHVDPEATLPANTEVVVYDQPLEDSESVGLPHDGSVIGAVPMLNGPGRIVTAERWKTWATRNVVTQLDRVLRYWAKHQPEAPKILVGNLSARRGGRLDPHKTHQSGRDVDLSYVSTWDGRSAISWQKMNATNLDTKRTWALLTTLVKQSDVEVMYADRSIQRLLLAAARRHKLMNAEELARWLEVAPGAKKGNTLLRHVPGHDDHLHVRFACSEHEKRCRS